MSDLDDVGHPGFVGALGSKGLVQQVFGHRQLVIRIRGCLEFPLLLAANIHLSPELLDATYTCFKAIGAKLRLRAFSVVGSSGSSMGGVTGNAEPGSLLGSL